MNVTIATIARTSVLFVALINQVLMMCGFDVLPFEDEQVSELVTTVLTAGAAVVCWWKNNSFTKAAIAADAYMAEVKAGTVEQENKEAAE